jgi:hypothetical protein
MKSLSTKDLTEQTRCLINAACENLFRARDLCESSRELRYTNSDFREFLRDQRLYAQSMVQNMHERRLREAVPPRKRKSTSERPP